MHIATDAVAVDAAAAVVVVVVIAIMDAILDADSVLKRTVEEKCLRWQSCIRLWLKIYGIDHSSIVTTGLYSSKCIVCSA